jgi:hypothetical protein
VSGRRSHGPTRRARPWALAVLGLAAASALTPGCSTSSAPGSASGTTAPATSAPGTSAPAPGTTKALVATYGPKACSLLEVGEIAPLLGFEPERVASTPANFLGGGYTSACDFRHPQDPDRQGKTVRILVFPPATDLEVARKALTDAADRSGLAVPAYTGRAPEGSGSGPNTIMLLAPEQGFSITVVNGADHADDADLVALADKALPRYLAQPRGPSSTPSTPST